MAEQPHPARSVTRDELYPDGIIPPDVAEMEAQYGRFIQGSALELFDGRQIHLGRFERAWRMFCHNPHNDPERQDAALWVSYEMMECLQLMFMSCRDQSEELWHHIRQFNETQTLPPPPPPGMLG
jgi:hypothetical protein